MFMKLNLLNKTYSLGVRQPETITHRRHSERSIWLYL